MAMVDNVSESIEFRAIQKALAIIRKAGSGELNIKVTDSRVSYLESTTGVKLPAKEA